MVLVCVAADSGRVMYVGLDSHSCVCLTCGSACFKRRRHR